jgi:restriction system protein
VVKLPKGLYLEPNASEKATKRHMSGLEFEVFVRHCLIKNGYPHVETTPSSGDYGADLIVRQNEKPRVIAIQCKRSATPVGVQAIQEVLGAKNYYRASEAWVVTNADFTLAARKLAQSACVRLKRLVWSDAAR